jgi:PhoH-like ATPase
MAHEKLFILDTNVLVHDPQAIFAFAPHIVGIPITVLEELDRFKTDTTQRGYHSREVIRQLDLLRGRGSLSEGITLDNGGKLKVLLYPAKDTCPSLLVDHTADNVILRTAYCLKDSYDIRFISKDLNTRVKADVLGIEALDYIKDNITQEEFYKGWVTIQVPAVQLKKDNPEELEALAQEYDFTLNEYVILESRHNTYNYAIFRYIGNKKFKRIQTPQLKWQLEPRNAQQLMALDLLFDQDIQLVTLLGPAGTGKTFLALLAGLHQVLVEHEYEKIMVTRPVIPLGPDIGYLPGDIREKLHFWMQPIYDNMEFIAHSVNIQKMAIARDEEEYKGGKFKHKKNKDRVVPTLDELIKENKLSLEAITYMRGRSIPYQYILIDEVQNLTSHEVKTLISRVGEGSKIILAGDPYQIDSPYLDFNGNGLVVATSKFRGQPLFGTVFLESSERSELSRLAGELL